MSIFQLSSLTTGDNTPTAATISDTLFGEIQLPSNTYPPISPTTYTAFSIFPLWSLSNKLITHGDMYIDRVIGDRVNTSSGDRDLNFGILTANSEVVLSLSNFSDTAIEVAEINFLAEAGIVIADINVSDTLEPNTSTNFTILAYSDIGLSSVNSLVEIVFTNGISILYTLEIVRTSSFVYSFEPTASSYSEKISYRTEVVSFTNGREARRALLSTPKRSVNYTTIAASTATLDYGSNLIHFGYNNPVHQPLWSQHETITEKLSGTRVFVDTIGKDYKIGGDVALLTDPLYPVLLQVVGLGDTYIDLSASLNLDAPFIVAPTFLVLPSKSSTYSVQNLRFGEFKFSLEEL